ncbi:MAG: hypothetical protein K8S54_06560 [Spirochaetia bacterium]|nr:hypothetical protein [Spirochaetia bacterium]
MSSLQRDVDRYVTEAGGYFGELTNLARLLEEAGEIAAIYARTRGELKPKATDDVSAAALESEMGDLLFVLCCLANQAGIDLDRALLGSIAKFRHRDKGRHSHLQEGSEA